METIYALSTVFGKSGVAVFRVSGPEAKDTTKIFNIKHKIKQRYAHFCRIFDDDVLIDEIIFLYFCAPNSFTGQDIVELHCHGSIGVIKYITKKLGQFFRPAEPGEFTKRAFLNGKLDLIKAEGIVDLINAETFFQIRQTSKQLLGSLKDQYDSLRNKVIKALAYLEACIDFTEEEIPLNALTDVNHEIICILQIIKDYLADNQIGQKIKNGFDVAIVGPPNSGKSSLLNYFAKRDAAIVTNIPGTTRDVLELKIDISGYPVTLLDTAGIRKTEDIIEAQGIKKAICAAKSADVVIIMQDINALSLGKIKFDELPPLKNAIYIASKADSVCNSAELEFKKTKFLPVSVHKNCNLDILEKKILDIFASYGAESYIITSQRHRNSLQSAAEYLNIAKSEVVNSRLELAAQELRMAAQSIGAVTGSIKIDDVLDKLFSSFCIGK